MRNRLLAALALIFLLPVPAAEADSWGWVGMTATDSLVPIHLDSAQPLLPSLDLLPEGAHPYDVTIHPRLDEVWIAGRDGDGIVVVDTRTGGEIARIELPAGDHYLVDVVFERDGETAWLSDRDGDVIVLVDVASHTLTGTTVTGFPGFAPGWMAVDPVDGEIYLTDWQGNELYVIDPGTLTKTSTTYPSGYRLRDLEFSPDGSKLYVANGVGNDQVLVIDPDTMAVLDSAATGADPWAVDVTPDDAWLFTANQDDGTVTAVDTSDMSTRTIDLVSGAEPRDIDISLEGTSVYVPSESIPGEDAVFVIDVATRTLVDTIHLGDDDSFANVLAVAPQNAQSLLVFSGGFEAGDTSRWSATVP